MTSEPYSIPMSNLQPKTFTFKKLNGEGVESISESAALRAVNEYIESNSAYKNCKTGLFGGSNCSDGNSSSIINEWGSSVSNRDNQFVLTYFKTGTYSTGRVDRAEVKQNFPYKLTETASTISIELSPNTQANVLPTSSALGIPFKVGISDENVVAWTNRLFTSTSLASIDERARIRGEFNVDLEPDSVKANFIREHDFRFTDKNNGVESETSTRWRINGSVVDVYMTISLYRGKTKVQYSISHPYYLESDGSVKNYNEEANTEALELIKKAANA